MAENNVNPDECLDALKSGIQKPKTEKKSGQFYNDMEWWLLVAIMRDPEILDEISEVITYPGMLKGATDDTPHSLIFRAIANLHADGLEPHFEALYTECEKIRESDPLVKSYSRKAIMELDFQATTRVKRDHDSNRIRGKFCAEQVVRRR